jgi:hypothetical protein
VPNKEAVIHWNAPPLAKSRGVCEAALKHQFTDHKKDCTSVLSHSSHRDHKGKAGRKRKAFLISKTMMEREVNKQSKFSFMTMESSNASSSSSNAVFGLPPRHSRDATAFGIKD